MKAGFSIWMVIVLSWLVSGCDTESGISPQPEEVFIKTYGYSGTETGTSLAQLPDGGFILIGTTDSYDDAPDLYLVRTDNAGNVVWDNTYPYQAPAALIDGTNTVLPRSVIIWGDHIIVVINALSDPTTPPVLSSIVLLKYSLAGALLDSRILSNPTSNIRAGGATLLSNNELALVEEFDSETGTGNFKSRIRYVDENLLDTRDTKTVTESDQLSIQGTITDAFSNGIIYFGSELDVDNNTQGSILIIDGTTNTIRISGAEANQGYFGAVQTRVGTNNIYAVGVTDINGNNQILLDFISNEQIQNRYILNLTGNLANAEEGLAITEENSVLYITGSRQSPSGQRDILMIRIDLPLGDEITSNDAITQVIGTPFDDIGSDVVFTSDNQIAFIGTFANKMALIKINRDFEFK